MLHLGDHIRLGGGSVSARSSPELTLGFQGANVPGCNPQPWMEQPLQQELQGWAAQHVQAPHAASPARAVCSQPALSPAVTQAGEQMCSVNY